MASFILIHPTVWPQYTNVTDRTDRQRFDSTGQTILRTVAPIYSQPYLDAKSFKSRHTTDSVNENCFRTQLHAETIQLLETLQHSQ